MSGVVVNRSTIDYSCTALEMRQSCLGDIKHGENIGVERILELF